MRVLAIYGSPRDRGNSKILVEQVLKGITSILGDTEIEKISLQQKQIYPCTACDGCHHQVGCIIQDDMGKLYRAFDRADLVVVSSPVYFNSVSAQLKILIDRCQAIWASKYILKKPLIDREKLRLGVFIAVAGNPDGLAEFDPSKRVIDIFFKAINTRYFGDLLVANTDSLPVNSSPEILTNAYRLGVKLVQAYLEKLHKED